MKIVRFCALPPQFSPEDRDSIPLLNILLYQTMDNVKLERNGDDNDNKNNNNNVSLSLNFRNIL